MNYLIPAYQQYLIYLFFGVETVICINRALNKSAGLKRASWLGFGALGIVGFVGTALAAHHP